MNLYITRCLVLCWMFFFVASYGAAQEENQVYEQAVSAYDAGEFATAIIHLKNVLQADLNHIPARLLLAKIYFEDGSIAAAEKEAEEALLLGADINLVLPVYGNALILQNKADELFELESQSRFFTPGSRFEWALLKGQGYLILDEYEAAVAEFKRAAAMYPGEDRATNTLAATYLRMGDYGKAQDLVKKALEIEPGNSKSWLLYGEIALSQKDYPLALERLERAHQLNPDDFMILRALSHAHMQLRNGKELQHYLDLLLEQNPGDPAATLISAVMLMQEGGAEVGSEMLAELSSKLSSIEEANVQTGDEVLFIRATADYIQGNDESAITLLNSFLSKNKSDLVAIRMLSDLYLRTGQRRQAMKLLSSKREVVSRDFGLTLQLIHLYIEQGKTYRAQELLADVERVAAGHPYVVMLEAEILKATKQPAAALALLNSHDFSENESLDYGLLRGQLELEMQLYGDVAKTIDHLQSTFPKSIKVYNFAAVTHLRLRQWEAAEAAIEHALALRPENIQARFNEAILLKAKGENEQVRASLNGILNERPGHIPSILLMAKVLAEGGDYDEAIDWSKRVYSYTSEDARPLTLQLEIYRKLGDEAKVLQIARQLSKEFPLEAKYSVQLAEIHLERGQYEAAQFPLHKTFTLWEDQPDRMHQLAALWVRARNLLEAKKCLEIALAADGGSLPVRLDLARISLLEGKPANAKEEVAVLRKEYGDNSQLEFLQGEIEMSQGNLIGAQQAFMKAAELDSGNVPAVLSLYQLSVQGVGGEAFTAMAETSITKDSGSLWLVKLVADSYLVQDNLTAAAKHYEYLVSQPGLETDAAVLNNLSNIYAKTDLDKALVTARRGVVADRRNNPALLDTIGWIMVQQERYEEALPYFRDAHSMNSTSAEIRYHTGVALLALGRSEEAARELRAAVTLRDDFEGYAEARRLLAGIKP